MFLLRQQFWYTKSIIIGIYDNYGIYYWYFIYQSTKKVDKT